MRGHADKCIPGLAAPGPYGLIPGPVGFGLIMGLAGPFEAIPGPAVTHAHFNKQGQF